MRHMPWIVVLLCLVGPFALGGGLAVAGKPPPAPPTIDLVFLRDDHLTVANLSGTYTKTITTTNYDRQAAWSPDGAWIAYGVGQDRWGIYEDIYRIKPDGTGRELLMSYPAGGPFPAPKPVCRLSWLSDGSGLVYPTSDYNTVLNVLDVDKHTVLEVTWPFTHYQNPNYIALGPDLDSQTDGHQGWIAFADNQLSPAGWHLKVARFVESRTELARSFVVVGPSLPVPALTAGWQNFPAWSRDGKQLAYLDDALGAEGRNLAVADFDSATGEFTNAKFVYSDPYPATAEGSVWFQPTLSPTGDRIAFPVRMAMSSSNLYWVWSGLDETQTPTPIVTSRKFESNPDWRPTAP